MRTSFSMRTADWMTLDELEEQRTLRLKRAFPAGSLVWFRGVMSCETLIAAETDGPDWFLARVTGYPLGVCIALEFADGKPIGIPFAKSQLTMAKRG